MLPLGFAANGEGDETGAGGSARSPELFSPAISPWWIRPHFADKPT
jgi:hypothetical protein